MSAMEQKKGFTIIEVVLVLAIAALIFLMVFVALPTLQATQRDTARRSDASIVSASVTKYTSAYKRALTDTTGAQDDLRKYIGALDQYDGADAVFIQSDRSEDPAAEQIYVYPGSKCDGPDAVDGISRQSAVRVQLEDETYHCVDAS